MIFILQSDLIPCADSGEALCLMMRTLLVLFWFIFCPKHPRLCGNTLELNCITLTWLNFWLNESGQHSTANQLAASQLLNVAWNWFPFVLTSYSGNYQSLNWSHWQKTVIKSSIMIVKNQKKCLAILKKEFLRD